MNNGILGYGSRGGLSVRRGDAMTHGRRAGDGTDPMLYHVLLIGQSNATGAAGTPILSGRGAARPGRSPLMLQSSDWPEIASSTTVHPLRYMAAVPARDLQPLYESLRTDTSEAETPASGFCACLAAKGKQVLVSSAAVSGFPYSSLAEGTAMFERSIDHVRQAAAWCRQHNRPYRFLGLLKVHGEQDQVAGNTSYSANVATWRSAYDRRIKQVTGQRDDVVMYQSPQNYYTATAGGTSASAPQEYTAYRADPTRVVLIGVRTPYAAPVADVTRLHIGPQPSYRLGWLFGRAVHQASFDSRPWKPLAPKPGMVTLSGSTITIEWEVPKPPLVIDYRLTPLRSDLSGQADGIRYFDDSGTPVTVTAHALTGPTTSQITLSGSPTGTAGSRVIRVGWDGFTNIRDSESEVTDKGHPTHNWAVIGSEAVS